MEDERDNREKRANNLYEIELTDKEVPQQRP